MYFPSVRGVCVNAGMSNNEREASGKRRANQLCIHWELTANHKNRFENAKKWLKKASRQSDYLCMLKKKKQKKKPVETLEVMISENALGQDRTNITYTGKILPMSVTPLSTPLSFYQFLSSRELISLQLLKQSNHKSNSRKMITCWTP